MAARSRLARSRAVGPSRPEEPEIAAKQALDCLVEVASLILIQDANASQLPRLPRQRLRAAAAAAKQLRGCERLPLQTLEHLAVRPPTYRVALLQLHALSLRVLSDREERDRLDGEQVKNYTILLSICNLIFSSGLKYGTTFAHPMDATVATFSLGLQMHMLESCSRHLVAVQADDAWLRDSSSWYTASLTLHDVLKLAEQLLRLAVCQTSAVALAAADAAVVRAATMLEAVARSHITEHAVSVRMRAAWRHSGTSKDTVEYLRNLLAYFCNLVLRIVQCEAETTAQAAFAAALSSLVSNLRSILSGACLQYSLAAHVVGQLAAADGGKRYGMVDAQALPPCMQEGTTEPSSVAGPMTGPGGHQQQQPQAPRQQAVPAACASLCASGLMAALRLWSWCMGQTPVVHFKPYSFSAVHELAMRAMCVALRSASWHDEVRQRQGRGAGAGTGEPVQGVLRGAVNIVPQPDQQQQQQPDWAGPLLIPMPEGDCATLGLEALRCAARSLSCLSMRSGSSLQRQRAAADSGAGGSGAGGASAALSDAADDWWRVAVPVLHLAVSHGERERLAGELCYEYMETVSQLRMSCWPAGDLPPSPPPDVTAALAAGFVPLLERVIRASARYNAAAADAPALALRHLLDWKRLGRLLAYGEPRQTASLMATGLKLHRCLTNTVETVVIAGGGAGGGRVVIHRDAERFYKSVLTAISETPSRNMLLWMGDFARVIVLQWPQLQREGHDGEGEGGGEGGAFAGGAAASGSDSEPMPATAAAAGDVLKVDRRAAGASGIELVCKCERCSLGRAGASGCVQPAVEQADGNSGGDGDGGGGAGSKAASGGVKHDVDDPAASGPGNTGMGAAASGGEVDTAAGSANSDGSSSGGGGGGVPPLKWALAPSWRLLQHIAGYVVTWLPALARLAAVTPPPPPPPSQAHQAAEPGPPLTRQQVMQLLTSAALTVSFWTQFLIIALSQAEGRTPLPPWWGWWRRATAAMRAGTDGPAAAGGSGGSGDVGVGLRELLLRRLDVLRLYGCVLRLVMTPPLHSQPPGGRGADDVVDSDPTTPVFITWTCMALLFIAAELPAEVAAALHDGTLPLPTLQALCPPGGEGELAEIGTRVRRTLVARLEALAAVEPPSAAAAMKEPLPLDLVSGGGAWPFMPGKAVGALLLSAFVELGYVGGNGGGHGGGGGGDGGSMPVPAQQQQQHPFLRGGCSNPACTNLDGDSEAALRRAACGRCGQVVYCGADCQRAHWRTGHKGECGLRAAGGSSGGGGGGGS